MRSLWVHSMIVIAAAWIVLMSVAYSAGIPSVESYGSVQAALDANPGKMVLLPPGEYSISRAIVINTDNTGLYGYGTIIQTDPGEDIISVQNARGVRIEDLTLTRPEGKMDTSRSGIWVDHCTSLALRNLRVIDNRTESGSIQVHQSTGIRIEGCEIINYKRIAVDDRTDSEDWGYAFHCINGAGIIVKDTQGGMILNNRVIENNLLPTQEIRDKYGLGKLTEGKKPTRQGRLTGKTLEKGSVNNWHQGSAILVSSPENTSFFQITGNYVEHSAQGFDLHCDYVVCSGNQVNHGMMGIKGTHGCRHLVISDNILSCIDLWGILLNPGAASHFIESASGDKEARGPNVDAGTIVSNNIVTDYGYGDEYWNWGGASPEHSGSYPIALYEGQLPENPPLRDVLIQGNLVYNTGRDQVLVDGKPVEQPPRYRYAVYVGPWGENSAQGPTFPRDIHFLGNDLHPGTKGISNVELTP